MEGGHYLPTAVHGPGNLMYPESRRTRWALMSRSTITSNLVLYEANGPLLNCGAQYQPLSPAYQRDSHRPAANSRMLSF